MSDRPKPSNKLKQSIVFRYLGIASLFLVFVQLAFGLLETRRSFHRQLTTLEQNVQRQAEFLSAVSPEAILESDFLTLEMLMEQTSKDENLVYSLVVDRHGRALTRFLLRSDPLIQDAIKASGSPQPEILAVIAQLDGDRAIHQLRVPILADGQALGEIRLGYSIENIKHTLYRAAAITLVDAIVVSVLLATLTIVLFDRQVRHPLQNLAELAQTLAEGDLERRANLCSDDEIGQLSAAFNQMAIQLQQTLEGLQQQISEREQAQTQLRSQAEQLEQTLKELRQTQSQLVQTEKMSGLGQLVAGIAHEINNPVTFIYSNLTPLRENIESVLGLIELYQRQYPEPGIAITEEIEVIDLEYLVEDLPKILLSMKTGAERIGEIVKSLRTFSRFDEAQLKTVDLHHNLSSTLMLLSYRLKPTPHRPAIEIVREYGLLPSVECYASEINQVLMNVLTNAIDALESRFANKTLEKKVETTSQFSIPHSLFPTPTIRIRTEAIGGAWVSIRIADNGSGIPDNIRSQIFDPFFTTKPVGQGTGLGLSIAYQTIVEHHGGQIRCHSIPDRGTEFDICIPLRHTGENGYSWVGDGGEFQNYCEKVNSSSLSR